MLITGRLDSRSDITNFMVLSLEPCFQSFWKTQKNLKVLSKEKHSDLIGFLVHCRTVDPCVPSRSTRSWEGHIRFCCDTERQPLQLRLGSAKMAFASNKMVNANVYLAERIYPSTRGSKIWQNRSCQPPTSEKRLSRCSWKGKADVASMWSF